ncbi:hypothetical protein PHLCEN_2v11586 [Hermanssonia centrifuga]|uniref:Uncharacterized protein n=1 Tax=Hermanssonia centrifuga TaxID=98765 RepID=A0A2R6NJR2_9APHY|nr:hypothetical protein PHLCEN_2v11586 [Hermanssonia centrifuga]
MSDTQAPAEIQINVKGPSELKLQITISTDKTVADLKQAIAEKSDVSADRQRLIYSGRVLKDEDVLNIYKIQASHTIHMVKGVSRSAGSTSQTPAAPQPLPTMQTGQNPHDPLTQLNGHMGFGAMAGFNPFAQMGVNPHDPNMLQGLMDNPQFLQQMAQVMSDPTVMDQVIASNPQLAGMGPQVREMFQNEGFRQMMSNPESLRWMLQMSNMMNGGAGGPGSFPAPGLPSTATAGQGTGTPGSPSAVGATPSGGAQPFFNPWFPPAPGASGNNVNTGATGHTGPAAPFPAPNPAMMQQMMNTLGGGAGFGGFGPPSPATPADSRPAEERFQVQLQQLQDMGFVNAQQNVRALLATGGNVHSAIEYILGGGGL